MFNFSLNDIQNHFKMSAVARSVWFGDEVVFKFWNSGNWILRVILATNPPHSLYLKFR